MICLPGTGFVLGADDLAEVTFARLHPVNTTPSGIWRVLGYVVSLVLAGIAARRALDAWEGL